ncbi:hypothetical protein [Methanobrevibacter sp.]|uniref:hypothetical protein n=1 Tax=Methanobrevibacter sp. TaxID=66852 RepID=UPI00386AF799
MTEKRFTMNEDGYIWDNKKPISQETVLDKLNGLHEENQYLKQSNKDARCILKREFDFANEQRQKYLDDPVVANAYDIIRFDMRKALDKLGWLE